MHCQNSYHQKKITASSANINGTLNELSQLAKQIKLFSKTNFKQFYSIYFALRNKSNTTASLLSKYIQLVEIIYVNLILLLKRSPSEIERLLSEFATQIIESSDLINTYLVHENKVYSLILMSGIDFESKFIELSANNNISNYLLKRIELELSSPSPINIITEIEVEHILPKKASLWTDDFLSINGKNYKLNENFPGKETTVYDEFIQRLGNLTLLHPTTNNIVSNAIYSDKICKYRDDQLKITSSNNGYGVCAYSIWNADSIINRQKGLAIVAKSIWSVPKLL